MNFRTTQIDTTLANPLLLQTRWGHFRVCDRILQNQHYSLNIILLHTQLIPKASSNKNNSLVENIKIQFDRSFQASKLINVSIWFISIKSNLQS